MHVSELPLVVSVGMTHPQNVAGLGVDVRVAASYGVRHAMAVAALSAQDERGVHEIVPLAEAFVGKQLEAAHIAQAAAVRIGALGTARHFDLLRRYLGNQLIVLDPVLNASSGGSLYADDPVAALAGFAAGVRCMITPNIDEARALTGMQIRTVDDMVIAGKTLVRNGVAMALIKGGHLAGDPVDVLITQAHVETFGDTRLPQKMRGTGCTLAMALACELALGRAVPEAVKGARAFVRENIARS